MPTTSKTPHTPATALDIPLNIALAPEASDSQPSRVHAALRAAILGGRLPAGLRLPSSRALATQLGVRRNAVVTAYEHLLSDGLAEARTGSGTFVAAQLPRGPALPSPAPAPLPITGTKPFALGRTHADALLLRQFARLLRHRLAEPDPSHFGYGDPRGSETLRAAIARHLAATRGIVCDPGCIIVTSGTQQALRLCTDVLLQPGDRAWMEDPGYPAARRILQSRGTTLIPVPVDAAGLDAAAGRALAPDARLAYVTPSHQFPTGVTMSMARRIALLDWAHEAGAWVVEDDYDSEFRFAGPPLTALAGIDGPGTDGQGRVIYLGTFSKTLFPGLRIGYVVLPPALVAPFAATRAIMDRFPPSLLEGALADLMTSGAFAAHLRRMRTRYRAARDLVAEVVTRAAKGCLTVMVPDQGLHLVATLPAGLPPTAASEIRAAAGTEGWLLSETRLSPGGPDGFVLGYSGHSPAALKQAAARLGAAAQAYCRQHAQTTCQQPSVSNAAGRR